MKIAQKITPCLWFDDQAEAAARYYTKIFKNSKIVKIVRYGEAGREIHGRSAGSVMVVEFRIAGQLFTALNGGPLFKFNEAISLQVYCENQKELDYFWSKLKRGGPKNAQQCGWLKDKYGVSWQVVPTAAMRMFDEHKSAKSARAMAALLRMKKIDIKKLERAYAG
ncbi:MAG TPA: VOC family protein [Opitutaceae bacterium]|nr:VOC family protein [Opitutaceae bacterium]